MTAEAVERYVHAAAAALQLPIAPSHRAGVLRYFALAAAMADEVATHPLTNDDEPAGTFVPVAPRGGRG